MKKPSLVLFDLGNVLVKFTPETFWQILGFRDKSEKAPYTNGVSEAAEKFECGTIRTNEFFDELERVFGNRFRREHLRRATASVLTDPIPKMDSLVSRVAQRTSAALVSNTNEFHYAYCINAVPAMKMLPKHYLSFKLGVMKPNGEFYGKVLSKEKVKAESTVFIDDVETNVNGARAAGMTGILFTTPKDLENQLNSFRIL
ncbi:MAG: HAD-IA family hydrolase [Ignavibacteriales bacterium]|nr:HAD-IA family hydrolase [Ignavibacteriales bacterium]